MNLTRQRRIRPRDPEKFPAAQLFVLALVRVAEPIALTSIFPYAWKLVLHFQIGDENNAAFYSGVLISAFALAEAATGMYWGGLSDRVGRKPVLLLGCAGTLLSLLIVGFAPNFWIALVGRALGGILNGNIGVIQTMVGELVKKPEHEPKAFAVMPFVWSVGTIIGPSIGGYFAEPAENFPDTFGDVGIFQTFPYLLPNAICAFLLFLSILAGWLFLEETHPDMQPWSTPEDLEETNAHTPLMPATGGTAHAPADLTTESYGTFDAVNIEEEERWRVKSDGRPSSINSAASDKVFTSSTIVLISSLGLFCWHSMLYDTLLPIFYQDDRAGSVSGFSLEGNSGMMFHTESALSSMAGGLGLSVQQCGLILSVNGLIALFIQAAVFPIMASWFGVWRLFVLVTVGHPLAYFIVPYLVLLPSNWLYVGIYSTLTIRNFFSILVYPLLLILIKEAAPSPAQLGRINGAAASTGAASRTLASPLAGALYGAGSKIGFTPLAWWVGALVALIGAAQIPFIKRQKNKTATVRAVAPCRFVPGEEVGTKQEVVRIMVEPVEESSDEEAEQRV
ncbi:permease of the major facilitator superfamily [Lineolata rhizophorae]|uniref:Permease of the major facilitator superfamily n=1 Tax=Lineolata rhizophorae TaxID=578093 RepID=A0A6A6P1Z4_9PEZI|nr:permease of the major facilitator superfamily [Lineolata rhizophorae]